MASIGKLLPGEEGDENDVSKKLKSFPLAFRVQGPLDHSAGLSACWFHRSTCPDNDEGATWPQPNPDGAANRRMNVLFKFTSDFRDGELVSGNGSVPVADAVVVVVAL